MKDTRSALIRSYHVAASLALAGLLLAGCGGDGNDGLAGRTVYAMTNGSAGNEVIAFRREDDGSLTRINAYATGGAGLGTTEISPATPQDGVDTLASQGALRMTPDKRFVLAVNAASNTVTSFLVDRDGGLTRTDVKPSGGLQPNTMAVTNTLVYVANVGAPSNGFQSNVSGLRLGSDGILTPITGSTRALSTATAQPASATFNPAGNLLAVDELTTNTISVFPVNGDASLGARVANASAGTGPFGSLFLSGGQLVVTEVMTNSVSSYSVAGSGALTPISAAVANGQGATCWIMVTPDQSLLYTTNTSSGNVSSYRVGPNATVSLLQPIASALEGSPGTVDGGVSEDGRFLYALNSGNGTISALRVDSNGSLTKIQTVSGQGLPAKGAEGLVVR